MTAIYGMHTTVNSYRPAAKRHHALVGLTAAVGLMAGAIAIRPILPPYAFMWGLALAVYFSCKWIMWLRYRRVARQAVGWRDAVFLFAWPGMDAERIIQSRAGSSRPAVQTWISTAANVVAGAAILWVAARLIPDARPLIRGWVGMLGLILLLHFGLLEVICLAWQRAGMDAPRLMNSPTRLVSLSDFWGRRWNKSYRDVSYALVGKPATARFGPTVGLLLAFAVSGLVHDLVLSLPAGGGYGWPTAYFFLQAIGVLIERSWFGRRAGLRGGWRGRLFGTAFLIAPVTWLFHTTFVERVFIPFMHAIAAI